MVMEEKKACEKEKRLSERDKDMPSSGKEKNLIYELIYRKYQIGRDKAESIFTRLSELEYIILHTTLQGAEKTYLAELAERLELPLYLVSDIAQRLKANGMVVWSHDGDGSEGTYLMPTELGKKTLSEQEKILADYYEKAIEIFGRERLARLLEDLKALAEITDDTGEGDKRND